MARIEAVTDNGDGTLTMLVSVTVPTGSLQKTQGGKKVAAPIAERKACVKAAVASAVKDVVKGGK